MAIEASSLRSPTKAVKIFLQGTMHSRRHTCPLLRLTLQGDRSREHVSRVLNTTSGNGSATSPAPEVRFEIFYNKTKPAWLFSGQCPARQAKAGIITVEDFPDSSCCRSGHPHDVAKVTSTEPGRQFLQDKADKHTPSLPAPPACIKGKPSRDHSAEAHSRRGFSTNVCPPSSVGLELPTFTR